MRILLAAVLLALTGCNGLFGPMPVVERLEPEQQRVVDESWLNMFTPPERLNRSLLLDVLVTHSFHERGVDRVHFTSEKDVWGGRVIMTVYFDRAHPAFDNFTVAFVDATGKECRRERYTFDEVEGRMHDMYRPVDVPDTQPAVTPEEIQRRREAEEARAQQLARRILIKIATRPAGEPIDESEILPLP